MKQEYKNVMFNLNKFQAMQFRTNMSCSQSTVLQYNNCLEYHKKTWNKPTVVQNRSLITEETRRDHTVVQMQKSIPGGPEFRRIISREPTTPNFPGLI